jgi:hypothetical protein
MSDAARRFIIEPGAEDAEQYARRVLRLTIGYVALFGLSLVGIALLIWRAQLFVTLTQRSNVETLTLAFLLVFFAYLAVLSAPGARGAMRIVRLSIGGDWEARQLRKMRALGGRSSPPTIADLNIVLEQEGRPGQPFELLLTDEAGELGRLQVDGARLSYQPEHRAGANEVLAYFERQVGEVLERRGLPIDVEIVAWKKIDDEDAERYHGMVEFARNLERQLGQGTLWPKAVLTVADCQELERRLAAICPAVRNEGFLPHWDYQAEHKLPIIPEPLGIITLSRTYQRVDPSSSIGCAVLVVAAVVVILALFIVAPPWVPGS